MKILAIRGKNLTSLAGEFEIPFQEEPLASAGLFAISGPTGAGKSTLLDALCLALYDDTPRLLKAGSTGARLPDVAGESVTPYDTRTLLRRGASDGYAEVDFVGNDGCQYRARWSVRRSRTRIDGRLQSLEMSLKSLPGLQPIGGVNREVKAEIVQRIGLSFEQFTRSVLLAQNEFSAFLKADDNERGELLETLTGIDIYSAISRCAYERAKTEQANLDRLNDRLADQKPLSQDARALLEQNSSQANQALAQLERRCKNLSEHLRWHDVFCKFQQGEQKALEEWNRLLAEHQTAAPRRAVFARIESVQAARPLLADCGRIETEIAQSLLTIGKEEAALAQATRALQAADESRESASQFLLAAERQQIAAAPDLDNAKALDAQLETLAPLHLQARQIQADASNAAEAARQALQENDQKRAFALKERQKAEQWLTQHSHLKALAKSWPRWDTLFNQATRMAGEQVVLTGAITSALQDEARLNQAVIEADARLDAAWQAMNLAEIGRLSCQEKLAVFDVQARLQRKQLAEERRDALLCAEQQWRDLAGNLATQQRLDEEAEQVQGAINLAKAALHRLTEPFLNANAALAQAERSLKSAETACAKNIETLRAALVDHEACPVCGALDHPYRSENPRLHAMLDSLHREVNDCREAVRQLEQQQTEHRTIATVGRRQFEEMMRQSFGLAEAIKAGKSALQSCALSAELGEIEEHELNSWFVGQQQVLRAQLQSIAAEEKAERAAAMAKDSAQAKYNHAAQDHMSCKDAATRAQTLLVKAYSERVANQEKLTEAQRRIEATLEELDDAFDNQDWMEAWRNAPENFHARCKNGIMQWQTQCKALDEFQVETGKLEAARAALQEASSKADAEFSRAAAALEASSIGIEGMRAARFALFGGQPSTQVQAGFEAAIILAKAGLSKQDKWVQQKSNEKIRLQEALSQAINLLDRQRQEAEIAAATLSGWFEQFDDEHHDEPITVEQLRSLLAHTPHWICEERKQLQAMTDALQNANTVLHERRAQRETHEQNRPTADSADEVQQALTLLESEKQAAQLQASALQLAIAQDQARRLQSSAMLAELEKQEATCRLWAQMSDLIGSADGKKFRNYAQQFTLDVLLCYANLHLAELSRRYRLERIKDTLALMVADRDMGDELRSVHSLSGGESFLVSLALALGLASLSSNRVRVESLFIDEGFGSLDAETLSVAMDALDGLQAMGRKVGVISHVQEMTERIATKVLVQRIAGGKSQVLIV